MTMAGTPRAAIRLSKSSTAVTAAESSRPEHVGHDVRFAWCRHPSPLVKLLDVGEVERPLRTGSLRITAHVEVHLPEDPQLGRDDRVGPEDPAATEVGAESLENDDVRGQDQEGLGIVVAALCYGVEVLPGDASAMTFVLPLPVAILMAYRAKSSYCKI